ncbi:hypothetical protein B0H11DRAFT_1909403 [Mycena galericulata]|nr:hypothetical protein B0H11DRAFT_1909403 [Mycena galericulata]
MNRGIPLGNFPPRASLWSATGTSHAAGSSASVPAVTPVSSPRQLSESDVARLNEELAYIDENDEHVDTAAGLETEPAASDLAVNSTRRLDGLFWNITASNSATASWGSWYHLWINQLNH